MPTFAELKLIEPLCRALAKEGYTDPTPIQAQAIPPLLEGKDVLGCAQTGTGKTAAFALPILQKLAAPERQRQARKIAALILTPTRELAAQIGESFTAYGRYLHSRHLVVFGGVSERPQIDGLRQGIDILVATPGRLLDLQGRGYVDLRQVEFFVLDEADRMLDMGFINDVRRILRLLPRERKNLLFSATMPQAITELAGSFLRTPVRVEVTPQSTPVEKISQKIMFVDKPDKVALLARLLREKGTDCSIVFTRTKHGANKLSKQLDRVGLRSEAIHGNKSQGARLRALASFKDGAIAVLIATDLASRGLDIDDVSHVFNYDLPNEPESYVHRIGRTGRAGKDGAAISFCDPSEKDYLRDIERLLGRPIPVDLEHEFHCPAAMPGARGGGGGAPRPQGGQGQGRGGQRGGGHHGPPRSFGPPRGGDRGRGGGGGGGGRRDDRGHRDERPAPASSDGGVPQVIDGLGPAPSPGQGQGQGQGQGRSGGWYPKVNRFRGRR